MKSRSLLTLAPMLMEAAFGFTLTACRQPMSPVDQTAAVTPTATQTPTPMLPEAAQTPGVHEQLLPPDDLRYTIAIPEEYDGERPHPLILALHYGGPVTPFYGKGFLVSLVEPALRELGAIIVAPDSAAGDWANPSSEANVLALLDAIQATYHIDQRQTLITGYSMGGMGTWYLAARHQERFAAALPVSGQPQADSADFDWKIPIYAINSEDDEIIPLTETERTIRQLEDKGADVQLVVLEGIDHYEVHRFVEPLRAAIPWIQAAWR
jgi:predicted peptidase